MTHHQRKILQDKLSDIIPQMEAMGKHGWCTHLKGVLHSILMNDQHSPEHVHCVYEAEMVLARAKLMDGQN